MSPVSYSAVPFDEDEKDKSVWFLDHDYLEIMYSMFKKVNGKQLGLNFLSANT
jgi:hypothetical protein